MYYVVLNNNTDYDLGLNVKSDGMNYATLKTLPNNIDNMSNYIAYIEIPSDAILTEVDRLPATDKFIITRIVPIADFEYWNDMDYLLTSIKTNHLVFNYCKNKTDEICRLAVQQNGYVLYYVEDQTDELCRLAVQQTGYALKYVKNQTDELCRLAVQRSGHALQCVKNQTDEICRLAVQKDRYTRYVKNQTDEIFRLAD